MFILVHTTHSRAWALGKVYISSYRFPIGLLAKLPLMTGDHFTVVLTNEISTVVVLVPPK